MTTYFQVNISPNVKPKPNKKQDKESEEISYLSLAPFTPNPKLFFEDILVGTTAVRKLVISNPTLHDILLRTTRTPPSDRDAQIEMGNGIVPAKGELMVEIIWSPSTDGAWRDIYTFEDGYKIKRDVPVVFRSIGLKKRRKCTKAQKVSVQPTYLSKRVKPPSIKLTSPKGAIKNLIKGEKRVPLPNIINIQKFVTNSPLKNTYSANGKENCDINATITKNSSFGSPRESFFLSRPIFEGEPRRETYAVRKNKRISEKFDDSLEMTSPKESFTNILEQKFESASFHFTPIRTNFDMSMFRPAAFSSEEKSSGSLNEAILNCSKETYIITRINSDQKCNMSAETYLKGDLSAETYTKGNLSTSTYVKSPKDDLHEFIKPVENFKISTRNLTQIFEKEMWDFQTSESKHLSLQHLNLSGTKARSIIEANLWPCDTEKDLGSINKEPRRVLNGPTLRPLKRKSTTTPMYISPPKRPTFERNLTHTQTNITSWSKKAPLSPYRTQTMFNFANPFILAATTSLDPFLTSQLYCDGSWLEQQEVYFKKWLNALLTPPSELDSGGNAQHPINVAKLWQECKKKDVAAAPSKESISYGYHTNKRLDALRAAANKLFR